MGVGVGVGVVMFVFAWAVSSVIELLSGRLPTPPLVHAISMAISWPLLLAWMNSRVRRHAPRHHPATGEIEIQHRESGKTLLLWPGETLAGANLARAQLKDANLYGLDLCEAEFPEADLRDCLMDYCDMGQADLRGADLRGARLDGANLQQADLRGARLTGALLGAARLSEALYDSRTEWPTGFDPEKQGCILRPSEAASADPILELDNPLARQSNPPTTDLPEPLTLHRSNNPTSP